MDRRSAVWIHFDREDHTGRSLDLSARLESRFLLRACRGHLFINRLMLMLGHSIALEKRNARHFVSIRELLSQSGYKILEVCEIPAPFPVALGNPFVARARISNAKLGPTAVNSPMLHRRWTLLAKRPACESFSHATLTSRCSVGAIFLSRLDRRFHSERRTSSSDLNPPRKLRLRLRE